MEVEQVIHQYGAVGLLIWAAAQILVLLFAWSRAGIRAKAQAEDIVAGERKTITRMLEKRDDDAREQAEKTEKLEGELHLLKEIMAVERSESEEKLDDLNRRLDESKAERDQLAARLSESEHRYQQQLTAAHAEIDSLRAQITRLENEIRAMEGERQKLVDELYREMRTTARLTSELSFMRGQHDVIDRVLAKVQPVPPEPEISFNPSPV